MFFFGMPQNNLLYDNLLFCPINCSVLSLMSTFNPFVTSSGSLNFLTNNCIYLTNYSSDYANLKALGRIHNEPDSERS